MMSWHFGHRPKKPGAPLRTPLGHGRVLLAVDRLNSTPSLVQPCRKVTACPVKKREWHSQRVRIDPAKKNQVSIFGLSRSRAYLGQPSPPPVDTTNDFSFTGGGLFKE